jgi:hypothetical protein
MAHVIAAQARQDHSLREGRASLGKTGRSLEATQSWLSRLGGTTEQILKAIGESEATAEARNHTLLTTARRVDHAQDALELIVKDIKHLRNAVDQCVTRLNEHGHTSSMWIGYLARRAWPNMDAFDDEITRIFPHGFGTIPYYRLAQKKSDS